MTLSVKEVLRAKNLVKRYGDSKNSTTAIREMTLAILESEVVSIVGQSGSGKSTLLNLLSGIDTPTSGEVFYQGKNINEMGGKDKTFMRVNDFGFVFQFFNLIPNLSAFDNAILPAVLNGTTKEKRTYVKELFTRTGLGDKENLLPSQLSGGEQQRVAIIRALTNGPKVLFADEPTGNLDSRNGKSILDLLLSSAKDNKQTLVYVTHDAHLAALADRTIEIMDGELVGKS
ncbi:MAG: ABC transporter ATP-binding protein [Peptococcaceae bacterium]|nr:ABC transporter ATP-binding protein [Peptococcaceae bacterium]